MNVYDFDQTIYYPDSSYHFFLYCLKKYPTALIPTLPKSLATALKYRRGLLSAKELKQQLFSFLSRLDNIDCVVSAFWDSHRNNIQNWYLSQKRDDDIIISASPEFLLTPIVKELGVRLIGTVMDPQNGRIIGRNCHDEEKVRRFCEQYSSDEIDAFYSDSLSDAPMALLAGKAYLVKKGAVLPWPDL